VARQRIDGREQPLYLFTGNRSAKKTEYFPEFFYVRFTANEFSWEVPKTNIGD